MANRTTQTIARFTKAFVLPGFDTPQPAGNYRVDHDEESIEGISRLAWRRVGSFIHLPGVGVQSSTHQMVQISPADLDAALEKDNRKIMNPPNPSRHASRPAVPDAATHLYAVGQAVRLRSGPQTAGVYRVTGILPPKGELPQYRVRNDNEGHERVVTQDNLEPANIRSGSEGAALIERIFGRG